MTPALFVCDLRDDPFEIFKHFTGFGTGRARGDGNCAKIAGKSTISKRKFVIFPGQFCGSSDEHLCNESGRAPSAISGRVRWIRVKIDACRASVVRGSDPVPILSRLDESRSKNAFFWGPKRPSKNNYATEESPYDFVWLAASSESWRFSSRYCVARFDGEITGAPAVVYGRGLKIEGARASTGC
ncbi:hypothetical protein GWI33_008139 [Rhynchophorus ferrugineus]|uniref:Uncharacterized protein n=1 Tax=Rhynchophorus ferrugineus TaxID=354439 RepID=A0A834ID98_RHYFE|nr:hypothetical protein GWI33_008139 [Rhynchophorus ferrugineus]